MRGYGEGKKEVRKEVRKKLNEIIHVFSLKIVVPYEATTQKVKNVAKMFLKGIQMQYS